MPCKTCGSTDVIGKCIICEIDLCPACSISCDLKSTDICTQKAGNKVIFICPGIFCEFHGKYELVFTCKECKKSFCKTAVNNWTKVCPTCKDHICIDCYKKHIVDCVDFYDKEKALNKLFNLIEGDKTK
ncbi:MAG: hypothetical protein ACFFD2_05205 [Promethearchaeota archaeon]